MKKLLIHSQNTPLIDKFTIEDQYVFTLDSDISDVDFFIHKELTTGGLLAKIKDVDIIFVKLALSDNYLEYLGLRLIYHLRLTKTLGDKSCLPLVIIAEESNQFIGLTSDLAQIFFTDGIYLMKDNVSRLNHYLSLYESDGILKKVDISRVVGKLNLNPPLNYESHHSIANEWGILKWSEILSLNDENFTKIRENVESLLYYKFLLAKSQSELRTIDIEKKIKHNCKVWYVDDEWEKGWDVVLKKIFSSLTNLSLQIAKCNYKDSSSEDILDYCHSELNTIDPDIVLLDLRLCDSDFYNDNGTTDLTGYKLLKIIKEFNPGIQVIVFTASNKVWNLIELQNENADSFVLKASPYFQQDPKYVSRSIDNFITSLINASEKKFIKELVNKCRHIEKVLNKTNIPEADDFNLFIADLKKKIELCLSTLTLINLEKSKTLDISFLSFYNFLECFVNHYIHFEDHHFCIGYDEVQVNEFTIIKGKLKIHREFVPKDKYDKPSWSKSLTAIFVDYFKLDDENGKCFLKIKDIQSDRNDYIHNKKNQFLREELIEIVDLCVYACSKLKD